MLLNTQGTRNDKPVHGAVHAQTWLCLLHCRSFCDNNVGNAYVSGGAGMMRIAGIWWAKIDGEWDCTGCETLHAAIEFISLWREMI